MKTWNSPTLPQLSNDLAQLNTSDGKLIYFGYFYDTDTEELYETPSGGLFVANIQPVLETPLIGLFVKGHQIIWYVAIFNTEKFKFVWDRADSKLSRMAHDVHLADLPTDQIEYIERLLRQSQAVTAPRLEWQTRKELIDPILKKLRWNEQDIKEEYSFPLPGEDPTDYRFRADYVLYTDHPTRGHLPFAIIEAKRESFTPDRGLEQGKVYANAFARNIQLVFSTNGHEFVQYDRRTEQTSPALPMKDFPSAEFIRQKMNKISNEDWRIDKKIFQMQSYAEREPLDGTREDVVKNVANIFIPNDLAHKQCFNFLADSILKVNDKGPNKWGTTLSRGAYFIRLNVGRIEAIVMFYQGLYVLLDSDVLSNAERDEIGKYAVFSSGLGYMTVKSAIGCTFAPGSFEKLAPLIMSAHDSFLQLASQTVKENTNFAKFHSSGVTQYMREFLGRKIPDPGYLREQTTEKRTKR